MQQTRLDANSPLTFRYQTKRLAQPVNIGSFGRSKRRRKRHLCKDNEENKRSTYTTPPRRREFSEPLIFTSSRRRTAATPDTAPANQCCRPQAWARAPPTRHLHQNPTLIIAVQEPLQRQVQRDLQFLGDAGIRQRLAAARRGGGSGRACRREGRAVPCGPVVLLRGGAPGRGHGSLRRERPRQSVGTDTTQTPATNTK